jgi:alkanesulfonate monooxygenase SsuD/methylene tetrahydromethanopterin reductase-like flavin-dependent oxidoreductase (luciferase family)
MSICLHKRGRRRLVKIGVAIPASSWPDEETSGRVEYGVRAERLGFDCLWANDHLWIELVGPRRPTLPDPLVLLSYLAAKTTASSA